jgi:hypothetical protein
VAVNSLHWIDPQLRYAKPAGPLAPGGAMVVAGCRWARPADAERFWSDVQADYRAVGYEGSPPPPPEQIGSWHYQDARAQGVEVRPDAVLVFSVTPTQIAAHDKGDPFGHTRHRF